MAAYQPPPEHLARARYYLGRGTSRAQAARSLAEEGLTDPQAWAAVEEVIRQKRLELSTQRESIRASQCLMAEELLSRINARLQSDTELSPRDLKALVDSIVKVSAHLSKISGVDAYEDSEDRKLRRALSEARLRAIEKASSSASAQSLADLLALAGGPENS